MSGDTSSAQPSANGGSRKSSEGAEAVGIDRRSLLTGGALGVGVGGLLGAGLTLGTQSVAGALSSAPSDVASRGTRTSLGDGGDLPGFGSEVVPCHGAHQAGIATPRAAHARYIAYDLLPGVDRDALRRMFVVLSDDIEGLTSGEGPLADSEPELAARPARLTVTIGVGPALVDRVDPAKRPEWLNTLPAFSRDQLGNGFDDGDLLVLLQADDSLSIAHAARMITRDLVPFTEVKWVQQGFFTARGAHEHSTTPRNLMGQVDGTVNPDPETDFDEVVWCTADAGWLAGGSALVIRRIRMELDTWEQVDRPGRELAVGRTLDTGAPLSGGDEFTPVDFEARNAIGLTVVPQSSHIARAHSTDSRERIFRSAPNYDENGESGLIFACYQQDPLRQFVAIQQRLDDVDLLNTWITHIGSAVFAILPGFQPGEIIGQSLFETQQ